LAALVVDAKGEDPKLPEPPASPLTSHPTKVVVPPPLLAGLMVVGSLAVLFARLVSLPPETLAVLVTLAGAFVATLTVTMIAG
jgi:hypothetical protein